MVEHFYWFIDDKFNNPVKEFILGLSWKEKAKIKAYMIELKLQGHNLRRPMADYLDHGIYELRPKDNRIFYFFYFRNNIVFVHAIRKKTDKIPASDLQICLKRKTVVEELEKNVTEFKGEAL